MRVSSPGGSTAGAVAQPDGSVGSLVMLVVHRPGLVAVDAVESVAFDLERAARTAQLVAHLLEQAFERGIFGAYQAGAQLVPGVMAASVD